jgi:Resolvase, N terminal domain
VLFGYARVSTADQNPDHQIDALLHAGVAANDIYVDHASGAKASRPELDTVLRMLRDGDTLKITRLDRLGRSALANTGQILTRIGHHSYTLSPRPGLLHRREIARCLRHTRDPLDLPAAAVLHRALTCSRDRRARDALSNPEEQAAAQRLIAGSDGLELARTPTKLGILRPSASRRTPCQPDVPASPGHPGGAALTAPLLRDPG